MTERKSSGNGRAPRRPKAAVGRPSLIFDRVRVQRFLDTIAAGSFLVIAARVAGISERAIHDWLTHGARAREVDEQGKGVPEADAPYLHFLREYEEAAALAEATVAANLMKQTADSPTAAIGMLKIRWPQRWREAPTQMEVSGPGGGPIALVPVLAEMTDEELEAKAKQLDAELAEDDDDDEPTDA